MECKLDRKTEAYHISESGWKESARQQSVKNISSGYQQGEVREEAVGRRKRTTAETCTGTGRTDKW